jgi:hypothetical protein
MADDHDALLARADAMLDRFTARQTTAVPGTYTLIRNLCDALRDLRTDRTAALDVIARLTTGWDHRQMPLGREWYRDPFLVDEPTSEPMSEREWRVFCDAAQRATRDTT